MDQIILFVRFPRGFAVRTPGRVGAPGWGGGAVRRAYIRLGLGALTHAVLSLSLHDPSVCVLPAVQDAAGAAEKSKIQEWPLYEVSRSRLFADP